MLRLSPSRSLSSSSFTTTSSSSPASASIARTPSTHRLKRWFSTHLLPHQNPDPSNDNKFNNLKPSTTDIFSSSDFHSQQSSTIKISRDHDLGLPRFAELDHDDEVDYRSDTQHLRRRHREEQEQEREADIALSDSYAAFCREFTSSPVHFRNAPALPLPRLPASASWEDDQGAAGPDGDSAAPVEGASQIDFLPVGAHGYDPASWVLPRPPSPPPGILTPARYGEIQRQQQREKLEEDKQKRKRGYLRWCMSVSVSWWPWARAKES
ncbi:hypothetical protein BJX76DRAFT_19693 [Aspergillus varians]